MADRADNLLHANGPLIEDRCEFLSARVRGKDVLDIVAPLGPAETMNTRRRALLERLVRLEVLARRDAHLFEVA
jgi:hypothetical protein